jgi:hypothetical protein
MNKKPKCKPKITPMQQRTTEIDSEAVKNDSANESKNSATISNEPSEDSQHQEMSVDVPNSESRENSKTSDRKSSLVSQDKPAEPQPPAEVVVPEASAPVEVTPEVSNHSVLEAEPVKSQLSNTEVEICDPIEPTPIEEPEVEKSPISDQPKEEAEMKIEEKVVPAARPRGRPRLNPSVLAVPLTDEKSNSSNKCTSTKGKFPAGFGTPT